MSAVNLWIPRKLQSRTWFTELLHKWRFVRISENESSAHRQAQELQIWSTPFNRLSALFSSLLHKVREPLRRQILRALESMAHNNCRKESMERKAKGTVCVPRKVTGERRGLLQRIHQARNRAVQILVRAAQFFNLLDGMQHSGVVLATELSANLGKRGSGKLLDDIHGHLARIGNRARVTADF